MSTVVTTTDALEILAKRLEFFIQKCVDATQAWAKKAHQDVGLDSNILSAMAHLYEASFSDGTVIAMVKAMLAITGHEAEIPKALLKPIPPCPYLIVVPLASFNSHDYTLGSPIAYYMYGDRWMTSHGAIGNHLPYKPGVLRVATEAEIRKFITTMHKYDPMSLLKLIETWDGSKLTDGE